MKKQLLTALLAIALPLGGFANHLPRHLKKLTPEQQQKLVKQMRSRLARPHSKKQSARMGLTLAATPSSIQLGMNDVPVFDQGWEWGTCATVSTVAALNALHHLTGDDRISATCYLQLSRTLQAPLLNEDDTYSFWDGSLPGHALLVMSHYGVWTVADEHRYGCGGLTKYPFTEGQSNDIDAPTLSMDTIYSYARAEDSMRKTDGGYGEAMAVDDYEKHANYSLLQYGDWKLVHFDVDATTSDGLKAIKEALAQGKRIVIGMYVDAFAEGSAYGATVNYRADNGNHDAYVLTSEIINDVETNPYIGAHAVILTGYDDNAEITLADGSKQYGALTIRNSAGAEMGDNGDFYMSYKYFLSGMVFDTVYVIG
jgi:hypothetical protein